MSGFFARMAERGAGLEQPLRLRPAQPFEATFAEPPAIAPPASVPPPAEDRPAADRPPAVVADEPPAASPPPAVGADESPVAVAAHEPPPERGVGDPAPLVARASVPDGVALEPAAGNEPGRRTPAPGDERRRRESESEPTVAAPPAPPQAPAEPPPGRAPEPEALPPAPPAPARRARRPPRAPRSPEVDVVTLLREHVVPVLVERRAIDRRERPVAADRPAVPRPGTVSVAPVDIVAEDEAPQVNVSIGRVVVTRAPAPPPPAPAPRPTTVDHEAYLARRRMRP